MSQLPPPHSLRGVGTLIVFVGEARRASVFRWGGGGARAGTARYFKPDLPRRLKVCAKNVRDVLQGKRARERRSVDQLCGIEGARVKRTYELLAQQHGVAWRRRDYDPTNWDISYVPNRCVSAATARLHGLAEAGCLFAAGLRAGDRFSAYGQASLIRITTSPISSNSKRLFPWPLNRKAAKGSSGPNGAGRARACRDRVRRTGLLERFFPDRGSLNAAGR